jgi:hypothetical protein
LKTFLFARIPRTIALLSACALNACGNGNTQEAALASYSAEDVPTREPVDVVAVVDHSNSITLQERTRQQELLRELVQELSFDDRLVIQVAHAEGVREGIAPIVAVMPSARNGERPARSESLALESAKRSADQAVRTLSANPVIARTDLIATMHTAANRFVPSDASRPLLLIMSDMLQCAGDVCFETPGSSVPDASWTTAEKEEGTLPELSGICVSVVGADPSSSHGVRVREFWARYFEAAGAKFEKDRYRYDVSAISSTGCDP